MPVVLDTSRQHRLDYGVTRQRQQRHRGRPGARRAGHLLGGPRQRQPTTARAAGPACGKAPKQLRRRSRARRRTRARRPVPDAAHVLQRPAVHRAWQASAWTGAADRRAATSSRTASAAPLASLEGCEQLPFEPSLEADPRSSPAKARPEGRPATSASTPTGLDVNVDVDQQGTLSAGALADAACAARPSRCPEGMLLNPSAANGLEACSEAQIGYRRPGAAGPARPRARRSRCASNRAGGCPLASRRSARSGSRRRCSQKN